MAFISYTRNFEDVMLNRAFAGIQTGFYIDVGAYHPITDSNTYAMYRRGWRGVALEPQEGLRGAWALHRPLDVLIGAAAGKATGEVVFYEIQGRDQNATTCKAIADLHQREGCQVLERRLPMITLDEVLLTHRPAGEIHCLSIDVEGAEEEVLLGLDRTRFRPWLVVIESTVPNRPKTNHEAWEPLLLSTGYEYAYFDAVNRYYVAQEHRRLMDCFQFPPCVWDDFVDHRLLKAAEAAQQAQAELARIKAQLRQLSQ